MTTPRVPPIVTLLLNAPVVAPVIAPEISLVPSNDRPHIVRAVSNFVAVEALPVRAPSKLAKIVPFVPPNTSFVFVASGIKVNFCELLSKPKKPTFATVPLCQRNSTPLSLLSFTVGAVVPPSVMIGSSTVMVSTLAVIVSPVITKSPFTVRSPLIVPPAEGRYDVVSISHVVEVLFSRPSVVSPAILFRCVFISSKDHVTAAEPSKFFAVEPIFNARGVVSFAAEPSIEVIPSSATAPVPLFNASPVVPIYIVWFIGAAPISDGTNSLLSVPVT